MTVLLIWFNSVNCLCDQVRKLEAQGIPSKQAEVITAAITEVLHDSLENVSHSFMTKAEMQKVCLLSIFSSFLNRWFTCLVVGFFYNFVNYLVLFTVFTPAFFAFSFRMLKLNSTFVMEIWDWIGKLWVMST